MSDSLGPENQMSHPTIDFEALGGLNLDRLERALQLHLWRDQACKHILAALLCEGDERVLAALRELVILLRSRPLAA
jgi:hypothetical protein